MADQREVPAELTAWVRMLVDEFGLRDGDVPVGAVLGLASDVAHRVTRPGAPVSAFIAGVVAERSGRSPEEVIRIIREMTEQSTGGA